MIQARTSRRRPQSGPFGGNRPALFYAEGDTLVMRATRNGSGLRLDVFRVGMHPVKEQPLFSADPFDFAHTAAVFDAVDPSQRIEARNLLCDLRARVSGDSDDMRRSVPADHRDEDTVPAGHRETQAQALVRLAETAEYFTDPLGQEYATILVDGHSETWAMRQQAFRLWLGRRFYDETGKPPGHRAVAEALDVLRGRAAFEGEIHPVFVRVGAAGGATYLDLGNPEWQAVRITATGWDIVSNPPVRFRRPKGFAALPLPVREGSLEQLKPLVNLTSDEDWILVRSTLVGWAWPTGPYPILIPGGEQGAAKTWLTRLLRSVIDPSKVPVRSCPRCERDLMINAANGWVLAFDNVSDLPDWLSDAFCRLSTGGGFGTRTLYADEDETLFDATRPIVINGIGEIANRPDLRDRAILLFLAPIPDDQRKTEAALLEEFTARHPSILGGLLDVAVAAMQGLPSAHLDRLPRMADFARLAVAAAPALGVETQAFLDAYSGNRSSAAATLVEFDLVGKVVRGWIEERGTSWKGTATDLLGELTTEDLRRNRDWPTRAVVLSNALTGITPALREMGVMVRRTPDTSAKRTRWIEIDMVEKGREQSSESSEVVQDGDGSVASDDSDDFPLAF